MNSNFLVRSGSFELPWEFFVDMGMSFVGSLAMAGTIRGDPGFCL